MIGVAAQADLRPERATWRDMVPVSDGTGGHYGWVERRVLISTIANRQTPRRCASAGQEETTHA